MKTILLVLIFLMSFSAWCENSKSTYPTCPSIKFNFFGEIQFGKVEKNAYGKVEIRKHKRILPLANFHNSHSNDWKRIFLQLPPEVRSQRGSLVVSVSSHRFSNPEEKKNKLTLLLGDSEEGYYPLIKSDFKQLLPISSSSSAGVIEFVVNLKTQVVCKFEISLEGQSAE